MRAKWLARLAARKALVAAARARHIAHPTAASRSLLNQRKRQVAEAERVLAGQPSSATGVSAAGVELVAKFEGFRAGVYRDAVGVLTQGYGETQGITPGTPWTEKYAKERLRTRLNNDYYPHVATAAKRAGLHLAQNQADALTSLVYNLGPGVLDSGRTMGDALTSRNRHRIADAFLVYDKAGGRTLKGLVTRRHAERDLFLKP